MKISHRWLKEFVETELTPREIADRLINAGIEVATITPVVEGLAGVVIAEIEEVEGDLGPTPAGHRNKLCRVAAPSRLRSSAVSARRASSARRRTSGRA